MKTEQLGFSIYVRMLEKLEEKLKYIEHSATLTALGNAAAAG